MALRGCASAVKIATISLIFLAKRHAEGLSPVHLPAHCAKLSRLSSAARAVVAVEAAATCIRHNGCKFFRRIPAFGVYAPVFPRSA
jgi:hypothetical protein